MTRPKGGRPPGRRKIADPKPTRRTGSDPGKGGCLRFGCDTLGCGCLLLVAALATLPIAAEVLWG